VISQSIELIIRHEAKRNKMYKDSLGIWSIGIGRNLERGVSDDVVELMFDEDMRSVYRDCRTFEWYKSLNGARQAVIENMIFNMGLRTFSGFKKTIKLISDGDFGEASKEMLRSRWSEQVGRRSIELANMMRSGEFQ
jgi:lysozyme